jgi:NADP-dependent 3-hydroxy acid dehydrogenase YdfG
MTSKAFTVIAGVGAGTGSALARRFAKQYPVFLLARSAESYAPTVKEIEAEGGQAYGVVADVTSRADMKKVFEEVEKRLGKEATCAVSCFE